ncbi:MAG: hypothetical protein CM15mL5_1450 [uncultured marine virus]|nr:MAG: hypothetical protein CM15mL5_1450 [uncultured marine virus]
MKRLSSIRNLQDWNKHTTTIRNNSGVATGSSQYLRTVDWFDSQTITTTNGVPISWNQIADSQELSIAAARKSRFDEVMLL